MSKIPAEFWESAAGRELAATLHDSYWDALSSLSAIAEALQSAGADAGSTIAAELQQAAKMIRKAHDQVATLNDRICPDKVF